LPAGTPLLFAEIGSLALLAVAMVALLGWNGANAPKDYASQSQDALRALAGRGRGLDGAVGIHGEPRVEARRRISPSGDQAREAHALMESSAHLGKIMLLTGK
jgi:hypothetical protein